ncbi:MAG: hypothetical protein ACSW8K_04390, partial [bacterium]
DDGLVYETRDLDVSAWAAEKGLTDPRLLDFDAWSGTFFEETMERQAWNRAEKLEGFTEAEKKEMVRAMVRVSSAYFQGIPVGPDSIREGILLWSRVPETGYSAYVESIRADLEKDHRHLEIGARRE